MKYLKRVHTKHYVQDEKVNHMFNLMKQMIIIIFMKRHATIPNFKGNDDKAALLRSRLENNQIDRLKELPIGCWHSIQFDKTLFKSGTYDPLEKAKDKGALKDEITYNYSNSRKELLQVIERSNYNLKPFDFTNWKPDRTQEVIRTNNREIPYKPSYPCRLIPKEREQKVETRLFGNATIDNKHSLSLYTDMSKVVLTNIEGEILTISDKARKDVLQDAAQFLREPDCY